MYIFMACHCHILEAVIFLDCFEALRLGVSLVAGISEGIYEPTDRIGESWACCRLVRLVRHVLDT
jgi:hypothetical protein